MIVKYKSVFEIIGPKMIGPSSSHTAGAVEIGRIGYKLSKQTPKKVVVNYYESFANTHQGHGTDFAIASGILGFYPDDSRVPDALEIAKKKGIEIVFVEHKGASPINHPNTAILEIDNGKDKIEVAACSIGGGSIEVREIKMHGYSIEPSGILPFILLEDYKLNSKQRFIQELEKLAKITLIQDYKSKKSNQVLAEFEFDRNLKKEDIKRLEKKFPEMIYL